MGSGIATRKSAAGGGGTSPRATLHAAWQRLRGGELTAARAAASVAVGLAIGVTPLWGTHFFLVLAVCVPLRLDVPVAYFAANISLPFIAPFLTFAEIEIGARLLDGAFLPLTSRQAMLARGVWPFVKEIAVGTLLFSPMMAALGGGITYAVARGLGRGRRPNEEDAWFDEVLEQVAERYAQGKRATRGYVRAKMTHDPVVRAVLSMGREAPLGHVLDLGCGRGQLAVALLVSKGAARADGVDWDAAKIDEAQKASARLEADFAVGDVRESRVAPCDTALLIDVLHYFTDEEQDTILDAAARTARTVVVRDLDPDCGWRSKVTRLQEAITTAVRFNHGARLNVRPISAITRRLEARGFRAEVTPCWQGTPFANVLIVARRSGPPPGPEPA